MVKKNSEKFERRNYDKDKKLKIVDETGEEGRNTKDLKIDYPEKIEKLEELLNIYISDSDLKFLRAKFPDNWKFLNKKLTVPYDYFNSIDDYQKPDKNLKRRDFSSSLKKTYRGDKEIE